MALGSVSTGEVKGNVSFTFGADSSIPIDEETGEPIVQEGDVKIKTYKNMGWVAGAEGEADTFEEVGYKLNQWAFFQVIVPDFSKPYQVIADLLPEGSPNLKKVNSDGLFYHNDTVPFGYATEGTLEYEPADVPEFLGWLVTSNEPDAIPTVNGKKVTFKKPIIGQALFHYSVRCDDWNVKLTRARAEEIVSNLLPELGVSDLDVWLENNNAMDVIVVAIQGGKNASATIPFKNDKEEDELTGEDEGGPFAYKLVFKDVCDNEIVTTPINFNFNGTNGSTSTGEAAVGVLPKGEYSLSFSGEGIIPSGDDKISNEKVVI